MSTADKMNYLIETKKQIKNAIVNKGVEVSEEDTFRSYAEKIGNIESGSSTVSDDFYNLRTDNGTNGQGLFSYLDSSIQEKPEFISFVENLDTSNMTNISYMFNNNSAIQNLNLSNWNTDKLEAAINTFNNCTNMESLNIEGWDTSNAINMSSILYNCKKLVTITGILNMIKVTSGVSYIFGLNASTSCIALETVYIKNLNASGLNLTYCTALSHESLMYLINNLVPTTTAKIINLGAINLAKLTDEEKAIAVEAGWTLA